MGIVDVIKKINNKSEEKSAKFKEAQEDRKIQKILDQRDKSSDERYLERLMKEERERKIHAKVLELNKKETEKNWKSNMFKNDNKPSKNIFANNPNNSLRSDMPFLNGGFFK